jgi:sugar phosphate permease
MDSAEKGIPSAGRGTAGAASDRATRVRYLVLTLLALACMIAYLTRVCLSTANTTIQRELGFTNEQMGLILAGFSTGYFWFQVPGAWLGNRFGARTVLPTLSVLWSLCVVWTSAAVSWTGLWASRISFGLAQAGLMPCSAKVLADWFPDKQRGIVSAVLGSSMSVGAIVASGLTALLLTFFHWRSVFLTYSAVGVVWAGAFYLLFRNRPQQHPWTNQAERDLIRENATRRETNSSRSSSANEDQIETKALLLAMLTSISLWLCCALSFFEAFGYEFFVTWFPAYLERRHGILVTRAGALTMIPLAGFVIGAMFGGVLVDRLLIRTKSKWISRSASAAVALILCAVCTLAAVSARGLVAAVVIISLGSFLSGLASPAAWAVTMDISGSRAAIIAGITNMAGTVGAVLCPLTLGYTFSYIERSSSSWNLLLYLFVGIYIAGALSSLLLNPNRPVIPGIR